MRKRGKIAFASTVALLGLLTLGQGLYVPAKAQVAQWLLNRAWDQALISGDAQQPWPWADALPVARLRWPEGGVDQIVLSNASARGMAFGPGHVGGSAQPGQSGHVMLTAHRDTHFAFLGEVVTGDLLELEHTSGTSRYQVTGRQVIDVALGSILLNPEHNQLTLVTCWPLDAWASGGSQRLLIHLQPAPSQRAALPQLTDA
ncbi:MAG: class GN sortase [Lysobacterales bacterium]